jgi:DNA polymerase-3 subunit beta
MKFICEKTVLLKEIGIAQEIIVSKNPISILSNIYLEAQNQSLIIKSSDVKLNFTTRVPISVAREGKISIKADTFFGILNSLPDGEVEFEMFENKMIIKPVLKKIRFQISTVPADQYPEFPNSDDVVFFDFKIKDIRSMISQTIFSVSDDESRYFMNGVYFEKNESKIIMVSTDGRRLAYIENELENPLIDFKGVIIPEKILSVVFKRSGDEGKISIAISNNHIFINFASYQFSSVLIDGQFPNYRKVIPEDNTYKAVLDRVDITNALKRVSIMVEKNTKRVYLQLKSKLVSIYTDENDIGDAIEELSCDFNGDDETIALNYNYIEEVFKAISSDRISLNFKDTGKAITIKPEPEDNFLHVIMPMSQD